MAVNRYPGSCAVCGGHVARNAGVLVPVAGSRARAPAHLPCAENGEPSVVEVRSGDGALIGTQNTRGRCEDAPCCGCCTL